MSRVTTDREKSMDSRTFYISENARRNVRKPKRLRRRV